MSDSTRAKDPYAELEYRCPHCNKLAVKGMLIKGYMEFKCLRCRKFFEVHDIPSHTNTKQYLVLSTLDGTITNCSTSITEVLGYSPKELIDADVRVLSADSSLCITDETLAKRTSQFRYLRFDTQHRTKNGPDIRVTVTLKTLVFNGRKHIMRFAHVIPLRKAGIRKRDTFNKDRCSAFDAEFDLEGNIVYVDRHACKLSGYKPEELIGKYWFDFVPPDEVALRKANMRDLFASQVSYRVPDSRVRIKNGRILEYEAYAAPKYDDFENLIGYLFTNWLKEDVDVSVA